MFFPKYPTNGLHGVWGKLALVVLNCQYLRVSFRPRTHRPTRTSIPQTFSINILHSPILNPVKNYAFWWRMTTLKLSLKTCLHYYFVWIVSEIDLHAKCLLIGWSRHGGKNYCCNISCTRSTTTTWKTED